MSMIVCNECDRFIDSDFIECYEDPRPNADNEMVCIDCRDEIKHEMEDAQEVRKNG
jgi:nitrate/TMAO reductase-like tetraheme cytochrome c subunit